MPLIRKRLNPADVYPVDIQYNEETGIVQSKINGDWVDNPAADPRNQTIFPPRVTSDPACDGAESVKEAFKRTVDNTLTLISESSTFFTVAGALLALFEFGPWGILIALAIGLAHAMLDAGATAITAAFADPTWHTFACILYCHMEAGTGRLQTGGLADVQADVNDQIGGLAAVIIDGMLTLAGEAGVNNLSAIGTSTGSCDDCDDCATCDLSHWSLYAGTETSRTSKKIFATAVLDATLFGGYGVIVESDDNDTCCACVGTALTGTVTVSLKISCGQNSYPDGGAFTAFPTGSNRSYLFASTSPFTIQMEFAG